MAPNRYRPSIPDKIKLQVVLAQQGMCGCGCGEKLGKLEEVEFDHCPPLALRVYDEGTRKYTPDANDPAYLLAKVKIHHRDKTNHPLGPHTSHGSDQQLIAKARPARAARMHVNKPLLGLPQAPPPARCRTCGHEPELCACAPRQPASSFRRKTA